MRPESSRGSRLATAWRRLARDEEGVALLLAILITLVLLITLSGVLFMTAAGARDAQRTNAGQKAYALAESGVNDSLAVLHANYPATYPGNRCLLHDQLAISATFPGIAIGSPCASTSPFTVMPDSSRPLETISFWGALRAAVPGLGTAWIVQATGSVPNPTGPTAAPITRTLTLKVPVTIPTSSAGGTGVLDWVYSGQSATFSQSVNVWSPLYVNGDITFQNTATVHAPLYATGSVTFQNNGGIDGAKCPPNPVPTGYPGCLNIGGSLNLQKNGDNAGSSAQPLPEVHIAGSCTYQSVVATPCGHTPPTPAWTATNVFASSTARDNTLRPPPFLPMTTSNTPAQCADTANYSCLDFNQWYQAASPGPDDPCPGLPAGTFDNDSAPNNSIPTSFNLTPSTPYTCETQSGGKLDWNPTGGANGNGQLTVNGTVYIDGSAYIGPVANHVYSYSGVGAIWLSGSFSMNGVTMCAVLTSNGKQCDVSSTSNWNPTKTALAIVANGNGYASGPTAANVAVGDSADIKSADFQGILAGTNAINMDTSSQVQGPIMSVNAAVTPSQSLNLTFPPLPFAPSSSPGQPPPSAVLLAPREYSG
jgi:hypothetical protein